MRSPRDGLNNGTGEAPPEDVGAELKRLREDIGLSQMDVAILCRVDVSTVSRWERGFHKHTHRSKDRNIRAAVQALRWATRLQEREPERIFTMEDVLAYLMRREQIRRRQRKGGAGGL